METILVDSGLEAFSKLQGDLAKGLVYHLVICAHEAPGLSGVSIAEYIRSAPRLTKVPVILYGKGPNRVQLEKVVMAGGQGIHGAATKFRKVQR